MTQTVASVVTAIGVLFAGFGVRSTLIQRNRQFEALYIQRYWSLIDRLSSEAVVEQLRPLSAKDHHTLRLYFQLCQDEIEMYKRGWISSRTFDEWFTGMKVALTQEPFASAWSRYKSEIDKNQLSDLREIEGSAQPPRRTINPIARWIRGV